MKPVVYLILLVLVGPVQAGMLGFIALGDIKPDLSLAVLYAIGLLTGPGEAALAGILFGLMQDVGSASLFGMTGFTKGLVGQCTGILGARVLDITSPSNGIFIILFGILEGLGLAIFLQLYYGSVPFLPLAAARILPQALYTGAVGIVILHLLGRRNIIALLLRRDLRKEA